MSDAGFDSENKASRNSRRGRAFTLVELLVVVGVIGLLAALLLPALTQAKTAAYTVKCKGNLRQLILGMRLYVDDYHAYPVAVSSSVYLTNALDIYLRQGWEIDRWGRTNGGGVYQCPSPNVKALALYGVNFWGLAWTGGNSDLGLGGKHSYEPMQPGQHFLDAQIRPTAEAAIKVPADMLALGDSYTGTVDGMLNEGLVGVIARDETTVTPYPPEAMAQSLRVNSRRHNGQAEVAYCDGHVEGLKFQPLFFDESDASLRRWNIDHQPHRELLPKKQ